MDRQYGGQRKRDVSISQRLHKRVRLQVVDDNSVSTSSGCNNLGNAGLERRMGCSGCCDSDEVMWQLVEGSGLHDLHHEPSAS